MRNRTLTSRLSLAVALLLASSPALAQAPALDLFNVPNYANSKLPTVTTMGTCTAAAGSQTASSGLACIADTDCPNSAITVETCAGLVVTGGIRKFQDTLPGLCINAIGPGKVGANGLGQCLPVAIADKTTYPAGADPVKNPGADFYVIGLKNYSMQFHTDLPGTTQVRGYYQKNVDPAVYEAGAPHYLGPVILATRDRPVRVLFVNELPVGAAGDLPIPVDTTIAGSGPGPVIDPATLAPINFSQNRATLHLHGGNTQWISDGFQHQWTAPAGEFDPAAYPLVNPADLEQYRKGVSTAYVPDMWFDPANGYAHVAACAGQTSCPAVPGATNDPGPGAMTFYWTNQQSGRLLFYHDHAYGTTRLNVYAGEAAGYLIVDPTDEDVLAANGVPGTVGTTPDLAHVVPLVIQDRTFVPPPAQLAATDPTWDAARWGGEGNFWYPHVYTPNQWPEAPDNSGSNPMGRWDYGPWFWPAQSNLTGAINGQVVVPCSTTWGQAPGGLLNTHCPITPNPSIVPESFLDTPVVNGTAYPTMTVDPVAYRFQILNAAQERAMNLSLFVADPAHPTEVVMVPAVPHVGGRNSVGAVGTALPAMCKATDPISAVTGLPVGPDLPGKACWPAKWPMDARMGGVPDPLTAGPAIVQLGSEGGIMPAPAIIPPQPVDYETNKRNIVVLNVTSKALFLGSAERADVVIDFSQYAGKTLILYNDAPAPVPALDPRIDYFTGDMDQTATGGAPETVPGYGPNTRTIMQIVVNAGAPAAPWVATNLTRAAPATPTPLEAAITGIFKAKQPTPIVPEAAYSDVAGSALPNTYLPIQAMNLTFTPVGTAAPVTVPFGNKALHELFDTDYGRMNSLLGVEIPNTNWLNQTTIPFTNADPTTEWIHNNKAQIWKVTHNGVDTHAIHFHLLNAQVVNRVGWDGAIRPPDANELGWKDTVRMNPLEDIIIALQPVKQNLPWPLPDSRRPIDVLTPVGMPSPLFTGVNVNNTPYAPALTNTVQNFGWEYVWHCHLLGHEENDMLRPEVFIVPPETPENLVASQGVGNDIGLSFTDMALSEEGFTLERAEDAAFTVNPIFRDLGLSNGYGLSVATTDPNAVIPPGGSYFYRVQAYKIFTDLTAVPPANLPFRISSPWSNVAFVGSPPIATVTPMALDFGSLLVGTTSAAQTVTLTNTGAQPLAIVSITTGAAAFAATTTCGPSLAPTASCTVDVTFTPGAIGPITAGLTFVTSDPVTPSQSVTLTGTGLAPIGAITPTAVAFGSQFTGTTSAAQVVTVSNSGTAALVVTGVTLGGLNPGDFALVDGCTGSVAPAASCTISVTFTPSAAGARAATLDVAAAAPGAALQATLGGTGVVPAPALAVAPAALAFGTQLVGTTTAAQSVTVSNPGTATLTINSIAVTGAADYLVTANTCGATLAPAGSCTVSVAFTAAAVGLRSATLDVQVAAPALSQSVALSGTGAVPVVVVAPAAINFGTLLVNNVSATNTVTVSNAGGWVASLSSILLGGPNAASFVVGSNTCGATLAAGASCFVGVTYQPKAVGPSAASITVTSSDPVTPSSAVTLSGAATAISLSTGALAFGNVTVGRTSAASSVTVTNNGTTPVALGAATSSNAQFAISANGCGATLGAGRTCTVSVRFTPAAAGVQAGTLTLPSADPASPHLVALSGTGVLPAMSVTPAALAYTSTVNVRTAAQVITVSNTGTAPLGITGVQLGGANANQFGVANGCPASLAVNASCTVSVTFRPTSVGAKAATVTVNVAAPATAQVVTLTGAVTAPVLAAAPAALTFASQAVGTTSAAQDITVSNTGTSTLTINGIALAGGSRRRFAISASTCGATLAAGATCTVSVSFTPNAVGTVTSGVAVTVAAPAVSSTVPVSGTGL